MTRSKKKSRNKDELPEYWYYCPDCLSVHRWSQPCPHLLQNYLGVWEEVPADCPMNCPHDEHPCVHWNYGECLLNED